MLRVEALGHQTALEEAVDRLQRLGAVQIVADDGLSQHTDVIDEARQHEIEELMARAEFVTEFLGRFHENDRPLATFVSEKVHRTEDEFRTLEYDPDFDELYRESEQLAARLADIAREQERLRDLHHALEPWADLHLQISRWKGTDRVVLFTGTIATSNGPGTRQELREAVTELSIEEVGTEDGPRQAWVIMVVPEHEDDVRSILAHTDFEEVSFPGLADYPAEERAVIKESLAEYERDEEVARERSTELAERFGDALALSEALRSRWLAETVRCDFGSTERTFSVSGWIPEAQRVALDASIADLSDVDIVLSEPSDDDDPPILLENPKWMKPFEVVTDLYGRPRYGELDPTPLLSFWFFLFFGMALGDAGYGLGLMAVAWLIKNKLDVAAGVQRFMDLLILGGLASIIFGIFTGSYFALDPETLPGFMRALIVLDPLVDVAAMLLFSVALGIVHVMLGVIVKAYTLFKSGQAREAMESEVSTLLMWPSALTWGFGLSGGSTALTWVGGGGLIAVLLLKGRVFSRKPGIGTLIGVLGGAYGIYDTVVGHISDFLSYTRLAALGMASVLVGQVMNIVSQLMIDSFGGTFIMATLGIVLAAVIFVVGHAFNLAISLLGAFVHPLRLQFVEFFSKFYEGGGREFAPFDYGTKSLVLRRESARKEGG